MKTFKEIGKFPTKNEVNQEEDHYYDLCLFQEEVYKNVGWACTDVCSVIHISRIHKSQSKTIKGDCRMF